MAGLYFIAKLKEELQHLEDLGKPSEEFMKLAMKVNELTKNNSEDSQEEINKLEKENETLVKERREQMEKVNKVMQDTLHRHRPAYYIKYRY